MLSSRTYKLWFLEGVHRLRRIRLSRIKSITTALWSENYQLRNSPEILTYPTGIYYWFNFLYTREHHRFYGTLPFPIEVHDLISNQMNARVFSPYTGFYKGFMPTAYILILSRPFSEIQGFKILSLLKEIWIFEFFNSTIINLVLKI